MGEQQKMTIEEAIAILDPETSRAALFGYRYFGGFRGSKAVLAATEERAAWLSVSCGNTSKRKAVNPYEVEESRFPLQ